MLPRVYMNIYDKDDRTLFASVPITKDAVHEEEMMVSNFVRLSWYGKKRKTLPVGAYVVPFDDGVRYRLFDPYIPRSEKYGKFKYEPEFQHPVMWLGRIPFIHLEGDTTSWDTAIKRYDWTYSGPPTTIAARMAEYINWLSSVVPSFGDEFGRGWTARVNGDLPPNATCSFATLDILSAAAEMANKFECEYHFDFQSRMFLFGKVDWNKYGGSPYELKSGDNVGVVSVSESKEPFANCFVVNGGTKNLSKLDGEGGYVQVNQRLTLDEERFPDSIIDTRDDEDEPILVRQLVFDDIYPKLDLYIYRPRERKCWFITSDGQRVEDEDRGILDPTDNKKYKYYSKWYVRLAYKKNDEWVDYELTEERMIKDKKPMLSFEVNPDYHTYDSALAGKDFEVVYFDEERHETEDNVNDEDFIAYKGDYRIEFYEDSNNVIIPTTSVDGVCPKGDYDPDEHNNRASMYNVVVDDAYKEVAREELYDEAMRTIRKLRSDLNSYSFPSNPLVFKDYDPRLYIGQTVVYDDGQDLNGGESYRLETHIRKLTTRIDKPYIQIIVVGNEKRKGAVSTMKDQIDTFISGGYGGGGGNGVGGTTLTEEQFEQLVATYGEKYFLSKLHDDVAKGVIGFLKGIWFGTKQWYIDGNGNANLYNTTVNGLLKAWNAIINNVRSTNYTGDGMMDSGWRITNEYEGNNSKATFDYLYIRKKAIFEELEIRKLSHIGGNFCLSGASGRVWKVDYFDASGNVLGYDVHVVPWTLGGRIMNLFTKNPTILNKFLGKERKIQRRLTDAERLRVATIRVYMYNDDGSTETMGNWTVGAQARCQQFNVEKQMEFDGSSWKGVKVGNTYWYRLVSAVGEQSMEDGLNHEWIEFRVDQSKEGTAYEWADALSDFPSVGDVFVQMGHRTRADQSNIIMLETANEDSPAIKMYAGVDWWTYDGKEVAVMSPDGWKVSANRFEWTTSYGEKFRQTVDRGVWVNIPVDSSGKRRCYFNDVVSHNGCLWRCIVQEGTYTTDEPSDSSTAWIKEVSAGIAPYVSLSEQIVSVPCEKDGTATSAVTKTVVVKLMVSNLEATITGVTLTGADANVYKSGNNIVISFAAGASVTNKNYTVAVTGDINGNHYEAENTLGVYAAIKGNDGFEISASPDVFIWNQAETDPYPINIDKSETGNSSTLITVTNDGVAQPFTITNVTASGKNASGQATTVVATYSKISHRVWVTSIANDTEQGQIQITVRYNGTATKTLVLQFYCNLLGTWKEWVVGDTKTEVAERMRFDICDETGAVIGTSTLANYVKSSSKSTATLSKQTAALATEDARLQEELNTTKTTLEHSIEDAETTLNAAIQSSATTLNNKIDSTKTELEGDISSTDSALRTAINTAKTELEGDVNTVSTNLATYEQSNDRAVAALTTRVSNSETAITNTNTRVDTAEGSIQTLNSTVSSQGQSISALNTRVSTAEGNITTVSQNIQTVDGKFSNYSTTTQTATMISNAVSGLASKSYVNQTASSLELGVKQYADGKADSAESNAKSASQGYANSAEKSAKGYADGKDSSLRTEISKTGIVLDGNSSRIDLYGDKINFYKSSSGGASSSNKANISYDLSYGGYYFDGKIYSLGGANISGGDIGMSGGDVDIHGSEVSLDSNSTITIESQAGTLFDGPETHDGSVEFNARVDFDAKTYCNNDLEIKDELKITNGGSKYLRIYFDSSGNVCLTGTFEHPSARYKLVVDSLGYIKLSN